MGYRHAQVLTSSNQGLLQVEAGASEKTLAMRILSYLSHSVLFKYWQHPCELLYDKGWEVSQKALRDIYSQRQN